MRIDLNLPLHGPKAGPLEAELKTADTAKQRADREHGYQLPLAPPPPKSPPVPLLSELLESLLVVAESSQLATLDCSGS